MSSLHYTSLLRLELSRRNQAFAQKYELPHHLSYGGVPAVVYEPYAEDARHGNFLPASYRQILRRREWRARLDKAHAQARSSLPRNQRGFWSELDSGNSSDALLMNIFCHPKALNAGTLASLLGVEKQDSPLFGFRARVPLQDGNVDRTEIDMKLGALLVEAKLTEADFQTIPVEKMERYRDFARVFDAAQLGVVGGRYQSYQLLRNVLAAHAQERCICVLFDARRPDLLESWYRVMQAIRLPELRRSCKVLSWQELSEALPADLQSFLSEKYGITPPGTESFPQQAPLSDCNF